MAVTFILFENGWGLYYLNCVSYEPAESLVYINTDFLIVNLKSYVWHTFLGANSQHHCP